MQFSSDSSIPTYERVYALLLDAVGAGYPYQDSLRLYASTPVPDDIILAINGNAPRHIKETPLKVLSLFRSSAGGFGANIGARVQITEVSVEPIPEDLGRMQAIVVFELDVEEDMLNAENCLAEGCSAFLIDEGSTLAYFTTKSLHEDTPWLTQALTSQYIEFFFHSPAPRGSRIRVINTSKTAGGEDRVCRTEIWDVTNQRLVASGNQVKTATEGLFGPKPQARL